MPFPYGSLQSKEPPFGRPSRSAGTWDRLPRPGCRLPGDALKASQWERLLPCQGRLHACVFLIELWLPLAGREGSLQDWLWQGILGFTSHFLWKHMCTP